MDSMGQETSSETISTLNSTAMEENISVCIRLRPYKSEDDIPSPWETSDATLSLRNVPGQNSYEFDKVFKESVKTKEVYDVAARGVVSSVFKGMNGTIFAYGQTGAGKSYTMHGDGEKIGIMDYAVHQIHEEISQRENCDFLIKVSFIEIYNDKINDLLNPKGKNLGIRMDGSNGFKVDSLTEENVSAVSDIIHIHRRGEQNRHVSETNMNTHSSRSHSVLKIHIMMKEKEVEIDDSHSTPRKGAKKKQLKSGSGSSLERCAHENNSKGDSFAGVRVAQLTLVDLAGSERQKSAKTKGKTLSEGIKINNSLSVLSKVISQISKGESFVSYRDNPLTQVLKKSLGGNSRTTLICCLRQDPEWIDESKSTVYFGQTAKTVRNTVKVNTVMSEKVELLQLRKLVKLLTSENSKLQANSDTDKREELEAKISKLQSMLISGGGKREEEPHSAKRKKRQTLPPQNMRRRDSLAVSFRKEQTFNLNFEGDTFLSNSGGEAMNNTMIAETERFLQDCDDQLDAFENLPTPLSCVSTIYTPIKPGGRIPRKTNFLDVFSSHKKTATTINTLETAQPNGTFLASLNQALDDVEEEQQISEAVEDIVSDVLNSVEMEVLKTRLNEQELEIIKLKEINIENEKNVASASVLKAEMESLVVTIREQGEKIAQLNEEHANTLLENKRLNEENEGFYLENKELMRVNEEREGEHNGLLDQVDTLSLENQELSESLAEIRKVHEGQIAQVQDELKDLTNLKNSKLELTECKANLLQDLNEKEIRVRELEFEVIELQELKQSHSVLESKLREKTELGEELFRKVEKAKLNNTILEEEIKRLQSAETATDIAAKEQIESLQNMKSELKDKLILLKEEHQSEKSRTSAEFEEKVTILEEEKASMEIKLRKGENVLNEYRNKIRALEEEVTVIRGNSNESFAADSCLKAEIEQKTNEVISQRTQIEQLTLELKTLRMEAQSQLEKTVNSDEIIKRKEVEILRLQQENSQLEIKNRKVEVLEKRIREKVTEISEVRKALKETSRRAEYLNERKVTFEIHSKFTKLKKQVQEQSRQIKASANENMKLLENLKQFAAKWYRIDVGRMPDANPLTLVRQMAEKYKALRLSVEDDNEFKQSDESSLKKTDTNVKVLDARDYKRIKANWHFMRAENQRLEKLVGDLKLDLSDDKIEDLRSKLSEASAQLESKTEEYTTRKQEYQSTITNLNRKLKYRDEDIVQVQEELKRLQESAAVYTSTNKEVMELSEENQELQAENLRLLKQNDAIKQELARFHEQTLEINKENAKPKLSDKLADSMELTIA
eukprot:snap_masked-scaffold_68-processed-gene-0.49-mRNA-1 protein AED:0.36 eAED:0.41 QI:0/-1/0/1/-1/1/1/0/1299